MSCDVVLPRGAVCESVRSDCSIFPDHTHLLFYSINKGSFVWFIYQNSAIIITRIELHFTRRNVESQRIMN